MASPRRRDLDDDANSSPPEHLSSSQCLLCADADPQVRYTHFLLLTRQSGVPAVEAHLQQQSFSGDVARRVLQWVKDEVAAYSDRSTEEGTPLSWWEARALHIQRSRVPRRPPEETPALVGPLTGIIDRLVGGLLAQAKTAEEQWARFHLRLMQSGLAHPARREALALAYRALGQQVPTLRADAEIQALACQNGTWGEPGVQQGGTDGENHD